MKLELTFIGNEAMGARSSSTNKKGVVTTQFDIDFVTKEPNLEQVKRFWEMERAFNDLTKGRLHINITDDNEEG